MQKKSTLLKYFPDWPIDIKLEERPEYLTMKDFDCVRCVGRKLMQDCILPSHANNIPLRKMKTSARKQKIIDETPPGYVYQFEWCIYWKSDTNAFHPHILNPDNTIYGITCTEDGYWQKWYGFRGLAEKYSQVYFIEVPDPELWLAFANSPIYTEQNPYKRRQPHSAYTLAKVNDFMEDLEFAKLMAEYNFVVAEGEGFYHDMMVHIGPSIKYDGNEDNRPRLKQCITHYTDIFVKNRGGARSPVVEYLFGLSADVCFNLSIDNINDDCLRWITNAKSVTKEDAVKEIKEFFDSLPD